MAPVGLKHWMIHNDRLADEYEQILDLSPAYDPVRAIDPHLTLSAPLLTGPDSLIQGVRGIVGRNSEATYWAPRGAFLLSAAAFESRHEYAPGDQPLGVLAEPATTNKCRNYNANIDEALEGLTLSGDSDPAATLARVADRAALKAAGLDRIASEGYAVRVDNPGPGSSRVNIDGGVGNTNVHSVSMYWRGSGSGGIRLNSVGVADTPVPANYERFTNEALTPLSAGDYAQVWIQPNSTVYFLLNQLEEHPFATSAIITEGAATSRAVDSLEWPNNGQHQIVNQAEGMVAVIIRISALYSDAAPPTGNTSNYPVSFDDLLTGDYLLRMQIALPSSTLFSRAFNSGGSTIWASVDITNDPADEDILYVARWNRAQSELQVGKKIGGVWVWSSIASGYHEFSLGTLETMGVVADALPMHERELRLWNEDRGTAWLESYYAEVAN